MDVASIVAERERVGKGTGTVERLNKAGEGGTEIDPTGRQRIVAAPLDRLWKDSRITQREFNAGDKLRADAYLAAIDPGALSIDWNRTGGGMSNRIPAVFNAQHIADARIRFRQAEKAITGVVWDVLYLAVIKEWSLTQIGQSIFGRNDVREAQVAAESGLRSALAALADWQELRGSR